MVIAALMKIGMSLLGQIMTEIALKSVLLHTAEFIAKKTENELDNKLVEDLKSALNVK